MPDSRDATVALGVEMIDALMVIAPRGWASVELKLERRGDKTPRVQELTTSVNGALDKPSLGVEVGAYHGVLNEVLADLERVAPSIARATSVVVTRPAADNAELSFLDQEHVELERVSLGAAALDQLVFTDALFDALLEAEPELSRKQQLSGARLVGHDDWNYDQPSGVLSLSKGVLPWARFRAAIIGSYAYESETWMWGWANPSFPRDAVRAVKEVCDKGKTERGMSALWRPSLPVPESFALRLAGLASLRMDARAIYGAAYEAGVLMLALIEEIGSAGSATPRP